MPIIKQTNALVGEIATYRVKRVDGQTPKPYPKWKYTWILPDGVDAVFKSDSTGYPMVRVQWNEESPPNSPFPLICQVETDVVDETGTACISIVQIDVNVDTEIVNLNTSISVGATGQCIQVGGTGVAHDVQYVAESTDSVEIWWDAVNGMFRESGQLINGPVKKLVDGFYKSYVHINWLPGSIHNVSAYSVDSVGNVSNKVILQQYPIAYIDAEVIGVNTHELDGSNVIITFRVNNIKQFDPEFLVSYNIHIGRYKGSGDVSDDNNYTWTIYQPVNDVKVKNIATNKYDQTYTINGADLTTMIYRFKFNPVVKSDYDPLCFTERDEDEISMIHDFIWVVESYVPEFIITPTSSRSIGYTPVFLTYALHGTQPTASRDVVYTPTWYYLPTGYSTTGTSYIPIFPTGPTFGRDVTYTPTWINNPIGTIDSEYIPIFPTAPTFSRDVEYVPVYQDTPVGYKTAPYTPTFISAPTAVRETTYTPIFPTAPTFSRDVEYIPVYEATPAGYKSGTYVPVYEATPTGTRDVEYVPIYPTGPSSTRDVEYVPVFINTPLGFYDDGGGPIS